MPDELDDELQVALDDSPTKWSPPGGNEKGEPAIPDVDVDLKASDDDKIVVPVEGSDKKAADDEPYSKRVKKRIDRERRATDEWRRQALEERERREALEGQVAELRTMVEGVVGTRKAEEVSARFEGELDTIRADLEKAVEEGRTKDVVRLNEQLAEKKAEQKLAEREAAAKPAAAAPEVKGPTKMGRQFIEANGWWNNPRYDAVREYAIEMDSMLLRQRSDPNSVRHYEKIIEQVQKRFPKMVIENPFEPDDRYGDPSEVDGDDDVTIDTRRGGDDVLDDDARRNRPSRPAAPGTRRPAPGGTTKVDVNTGRVRLTEDDYASMRLVNLDPSSREDQVKYAQGLLWATRAGALR